MKTIPTNPFLEVTRAWVKEQLAASNIPNRENVSLARLFYQAMEELEKCERAMHARSSTKLFGRKIQCVPAKSKRQISKAHSFLHETYNKLFPDGVRRAVEVLKHQKELGRWLSSAQRKDTCNEIAEVFETCPTYEAMCDLRDTIEAAPSGISPLFKLVYQDVDENTSHKILQAINQTFKTAYITNPKKIQFHYQIYSDIDDTIKASLNDRAVKISGFYPSAMEFYKQLRLALPAQNSAKQAPKNVRISFLSGRLRLAAKMWDRGLNKSLPKDLKFFTLYGSTKANGSALKYYIAKFFMAVLDKLHAGPLKKFVQSLEVDTYLALALDKRHNIDRDLLLRPEALPIMIGDSGEADLLFTLIKNSGVPFPVEDERIPEEYRTRIAWKDMEEKSKIGNPSNRPLFLGFSHALSSRTQYSNASPDPKFRAEYAKELNACVFDNFVDNALYCLKHKLFTKDAADKVVADSRKWIVNQQKEIHAMLKKYGVDKPDLFDIDSALLSNLLAEQKLSPAFKYRLKLILSIKKYDDFMPSSVG